MDYTIITTELIMNSITEFLAESNIELNDKDTLEKIIQTHIDKFYDKTYSEGYDEGMEDGKQEIIESGDIDWDYITIPDEVKDEIIEDYEDEREEEEEPIFQLSPTVLDSQIRDYLDLVPVIVEKIPREDMIKMLRNYKGNKLEYLVPELLYGNK